jgi:uncharacterized protein YcfJ
MKILVSTITAAMILMSSGTIADSGKLKYKNQNQNFHDHYEMARVTRVRPIYREIKVTEPVSECWDEPVQSSHRRKHEHSGGSMLVGGLIGGLIGHQFGKGRGKKLATAVGTIVGAQLGHESNRSKRRHQKTVQYETHCNTRHQVSYEEVIDGYEVNYSFKGRQYEIEMPYHPGKRIKMRIQYTPVI